MQIQVDPAGGDQVIITALAVDGGWLATHPRAARPRSWQVDPAHWDGLADGHTRTTTLDPTPLPATRTVAGLEPLSALLTRRRADVTVAARPLTDYQTAAHPDPLRS